MGKTISVYVNDQDLSMLDRMAKAERRSRSAMLSEVIRRYMTVGENTRSSSLSRSFTARELDEFLEEDRKVSAKDIKAFRKRMGLG